ncbi:alpha/beta fold hydrolase [Bradyrhizobium pachyrhizi]|uniref:alpha/beta fold hydrolase n=1 Tax=Bradyrhizobium pachyrhizi TaxID=280333 RepID=UPI003D36CD4D
METTGILPVDGVSAAAIADNAATARTAKLFYTDAGKGSNVMLLHGWTCDSHDWSWQCPALESKHRVVAVDLRGHGRSEVMASGGYSPAHYVLDIESLITTRYAGETFILIGHSMGAQIATRLAAKRPDLVSAVVSVDGALGFSSEIGSFFQKTADDLKVKNPATVVPALFEGAYSPATALAFRCWHARRVQGTPPHVVRESFAPLFFGAGQVGVGKPSEDFLRSIKQPFYHLCRDAEQASRMGAWFSHPKSKVDAWPQAGHWIMQDRPDDVNAAIMAWVNAL